jgi:tetratricopeptide (TPR) repeat protein
MDTKSALKQALVSAQRGDKKRARSLLRQVLRREPHNESAWLLFAEFAERPQQAVAWLEHLLKLNPEHAAARERLAALRASEVATTQRFQPPPLRVDASSVSIPVAIPKQPAFPTPTTVSGKTWLRAVGCLAAAGFLVLLCTAMIAIPEINVYLNWQAGNRAYLEGDCREAFDRFERIIQAPSWRIVNVQSQAVQFQSECAIFLRGLKEETEGRYGSAFLEYLAFVKLYPDSTLNEYIRPKIEVLFRETPEELATKEVCDQVVLQKETDSVPRPDEHLPVLFYYCGRTYESLGELENAALLYVALRTLYPDHALTPLATQGLVRVEIELAADAPTVAQPQESGTAPAGTSVYVVQNDSPERIQIILSGPETVIEEIAKCSDCTELTQVPDFCPNKGPARRISLKPGQYEVLVKSISDDRITPYRGDWTFRSGAEYQECFYVLTSGVP